MTELKFHKAVYRGPAVDEAVKRFDGFAQFTLNEEPDHWVVGVMNADPAREKRVAGELSNYALGLTVQQK